MTRAQFEANLHAKRSATTFWSDLDPLLRPGIACDLDVAMKAVLDEIVAKLPGGPWRGPSESRSG